MYILFTIKAKSLKSGVTKGMGECYILNDYTHDGRGRRGDDKTEIFLYFFGFLLYTFTRSFTCVRGDLACLLPVACLLVTCKTIKIT